MTGGISHVTGGICHVTGGIHVGHVAVDLG